MWSYWLKAMIAAAMFFASLILHELGHSLVARHHGIGIASITLFVFGGVSQMKEEPREARQEFQIAIVGPIISLVLAALFGALSVLAASAGPPTTVQAILTYLAAVNLLGRLLALALIAVGVVRLLGGDFFGLWLAIIGWFIMQAGSASLAQVSLRHALGDLRVRDIMATEVRTVPADATERECLVGLITANGILHLTQVRSSPGA